MLQAVRTFWQALTLEHLTPFQWAASSTIHQSLGLLRNWRRDSVLLYRAEALGAVLIAVLFAVAPFVSTTLIGVLLLAVAGFWGLLALSDKAGESLTPIHFPVLLYWAIATIATAFSPVRAAATDGWIKLTLYLIAFALMARVLRSPRLRSLIIAVYLHVALLVSVVGLRQWFFGADALATWVDPESSLAGTTRVYSYLGNPNLLASYLIPAAILSGAAVFTWRGWLPKLLALTMALVNSACLILTFSRGGWIGFVVGGGVFLLLLVHWGSVRLPRFWRIWTLPSVFGGTVALLTLAVLTVEPLYSRVASIFAGREDSSNNFRINVWMAVLDMIQARPVLGIGPGNDAFNQVYPFYQEPGYTALSAYSVLLEIMVETGAVGLICFLWLLLVTFNQGWRHLQRLRSRQDPQGFWLMGAIAIMVGMLAHGLVDTVWYRPQVSTLWWFMLALVASYVQTSAQPPGQQLEDPSSYRNHPDPPWG
ncbi:MAG: IctB family putative bicarbonate transporter [Synechococcales bacterium]|nr:IctB family putative bicarbonate transporter [Synechococcales bacterium]